MKRAGVDLSQLLQKKSKEDKRAASSAPARSSEPKNRYLSRPVLPQSALLAFINQVRNGARKVLPKNMKLPVKEVSKTMRYLMEARQNQKEPLSHCKTIVCCCVCAFDSLLWKWKLG